MFCAFPIFLLYYIVTTLIFYNMKNQIERITKGRYHYTVNAEKGVVVCITSKKFNGDEYQGRGISRCNKDDQFNKELGMEIAKLRAIQNCNKAMYRCEFSGVRNDFLQKKIDYWTYLLNMKTYLEGQRKKLAEDLNKLTKDL